jgi:endogenous inhibitor of DNA gyrase (YacG/DUF329 family)
MIPQVNTTDARHEDPCAICGKITEPENLVIIHTIRYKVGVGGKRLIVINKFDAYCSDECASISNNTPA